MRLIDADILKSEIEKLTFREHFGMDEDPSAMPYISLKVVMDAINNTPTVMQWIPVTERMPEEHRTKNSELQIKNGYPETISDFVIVTFQDDWDGELYVDFDYTTNGGFDAPVTAWMPLPEPWEGDEK